MQGSGQGDQEVVEMVEHLQGLLCFAVLWIQAEEKDARGDKPQPSVS